MAALVESMVYTREKPWHGLGIKVEEAPTSADALHLAGLDWNVEQKNIQLCGGSKVPGYKANVRSTDGKVLGVVSDRYRIVQNADGLLFCSRPYQVPGYRMGCLQCHVGYDYPQRTAAENRKLSGKQLGSPHGRSCNDG